MNNGECLQLTNNEEPTPCFDQAGGKPCSLSYCPANEWLMANQNQLLDSALHDFCVLSVFYDDQNIFQDGKGEFEARLGWVAG